MRTRLCLKTALIQAALLPVWTSFAAHAQPGPPPGQSAPPDTPSSEPPATPPAAAAGSAAAAAPPPAGAPVTGPAPSYAPPAAAPAAAGWGRPPAWAATSYGAPLPSAAPRLEAPRRDPRVADAHADRVVLLPTAYTHPEGTFYLSSNEIVILQAGYAISDSTQVTLTATPPFGDPDPMALFDVTLKNAFVRSGPFRMAAFGSAAGVLGGDLGNFVLGRVGAVAQLCFEESCESSASLSSHALLAGPATMLVNGVGGVWRIADWAALLLEVDMLVPLGGEVGEYYGVIAVPGFRFPYRTWALDIAFARPLDTEEDPEVEVLPWIAFTYRFLP